MLAAEEENAAKQSVPDGTLRKIRGRYVRKQIRELSIWPAPGKQITAGSECRPQFRNTVGRFALRSTSNHKTYASVTERGDVPGRGVAG